VVMSGVGLAFRNGVASGETTVLDASVFSDSVR
jgi:hypothetical protein